MKKFFLVSIFTFLFGVFNSFAPPSDPPGDPGDPITDPSAVPIDGGLIFLAAAGAAYAAKKIKDKKDTQ
jgi:hypothetical protein